LREAETQILLADKLEYLENCKATILLTMMAEVGRLITGLSRSLR
jgi:hypothetical protein